MSSASTTATTWWRRRFISRPACRCSIPDLVHWTSIGHVLPRLDFHPSYDLPGPVEFDDGTERIPFNTKMGHRYAAGVWAPAIRFHTGASICTSRRPPKASSWRARQTPKGPGRAPVEVIAEPKLEDPCPLLGRRWQRVFDSFARRRRTVGPASHDAADGTKVLDAGKVIVEDQQRLPVLEGPKLLKRNG